MLVLDFQKFWMTFAIYLDIKHFSAIFGKTFPGRVTPLPAPRNDFQGRVTPPPAPGNHFLGAGGSFTRPY